MAHEEQQPSDPQTEQPNVRLAHVGPPEALAKGLRPGDKSAPALLVSYVYLEAFLKNRHRYHYRDWVLDSGAFSAHNSGKEIKLQDYIDTAKRLLEEDPTLTEVFALDVIGDHKASIKNAQEMWRQGVPAIPCFHRGSPWPELKAIAADFPKIALGGVALLRGDKKIQWAEQAFNLVWPKRIHGFGFGAKAQAIALPWHSVDATNWEIGPCRFGRWAHFGQMSVRGSYQNLRKEVEWYLELERLVQHRWRKQMRELFELDGRNVSQGGELAARTELFNAPSLGPDVRLAHSAQLRPWREGLIGLEKEYADGGAPMNVRLAVQQGSDAQIKRSGLEQPTARLAIDPASASGNRAALALGPSVRLAVDPASASGRRAETAFRSLGPSVRLAMPTQREARAEGELAYALGDDTASLEASTDRSSREEQRRTKERKKK